MHPQLTRIRRALRAGLPVLIASAILGGAALAWMTIGPGSQSDPQVVLGEGSSTYTSALLRAAKAHAAKHRTFVISGSVDGLYPGGTKTLALSIHNPNHFPLRVHTVTIIAGAANAGCAASQLAAGTAMAPLNSLYTITLSPSITVRSGQTLAGPRVPITLLTTAPDACQNATFPLTYGGMATNQTKAKR